MYQHSTGKKGLSEEVSVMLKGVGEGQGVKREDRGLRYGEGGGKGGGRGGGGSS